MGAKGTCELFNELVAEYKAVPADDPEGFEDIYLRAEDAKDATAGHLQGLFASLSLLAISHSAAAESAACRHRNPRTQSGTRCLPTLGRALPKA